MINSSKFLYVASVQYSKIRYLPGNLAASSYLLTQHVRSLSILRGDDERAIEEQIQILKNPFERLMENIAPKPTLVNYLFDYLYPLYLVLDAGAADQESIEIQPHFNGSVPRQLLGAPGPYLSVREDWLRSLKSFTSRQIELIPTSPDPKEHPCLCGPSKVIAGDGTICMFKESGQPRKLWLYNQIAFAFENKQLRPDMRISRLHSVVIDKDGDVLQRYVEAPPEELAILNRDGFSGPGLPPDMDPSLSERIVGILLIYVENRGTLYDIASFSECTEEQRYCWAAEIEGLVEELHTAGVVWGDAKPENVLVDLENRLWLIDFDGSYTPGWVDKDKKETLEGDSQGLNRMKEWLIGGCKKRRV
jgi:hypothetical protein